MPERKPSTSEGKSLKRKVESKDVKLRNNKIVEKTKTPRNKVVKKTIQKKGEPVKTVRKTVTKKKVSKDISGMGAKIGGAVGTALSGAAVAGMSKRKTPIVYKSGKAGAYAKPSETIPIQRTNESTGNKYVKSGGTYSGRAKGDRAVGAGFTATGGAIGAVIGDKLQKRNKKTVNKKVRSRTVNGVNKTEQRKNVSTQMKTMRSKRRGSKR